MKNRLFGVLALLSLLIVACSAQPAPSPSINITRAVPIATLEPPVQAVQSTATVTSDALPAATETDAPPPTPLPTATPTALPLNPLAIEAMRQRTYPGSDLTIEQTLTPGANYNRYIASYLSDGLKLYGLLTVPQGAKPPTGWPIILFNHGFIPPGVYRTTERYVAYVDAIARRGYIVFKSDYRGHGSSEGDPTGGYGSPAYTIDVLNALAAIKRLPGADPQRIGMWGHSMGGQVTLRAMVTSPEIKAGVIWAGVVGSYPNLLSHWHARPDGAPPGVGSSGDPDALPSSGASRRWRQQLIDTYGSPDANPAFWASISPNSYVSELSGPLQLHHDINDHEVPFQFSLDLKNDVNQAGGNAQLYSYPGDDHNLTQSFGLAMQRTLAFFDQYVKGE